MESITDRLQAQRLELAYVSDRLQAEKETTATLQVGSTPLHHSMTIAPLHDQPTTP